MPEPEITAPVEEPPVEPTDEAPPVEGAPDPTPAPEGPSAEQELFAKALPEFAEDYDQFTPAQRERLLAQRLAAVSAEDAPSTGEPQPGTRSDKGDESRTPPIPEPPVVDFNRMTADLTSSFGEDEAKVMMSALRPAIEYTNSMALVMAQALGEQRKELDKLKGETLVPRQLEQAVLRVPGARATDIASAKQYLERGEVRDPVLAIKLAKADREAEAAGVQPSGDSKRKAQGIAASRAAGTTRSPGAIPDRIPTTPEEWRARYAADEKRK